MKSFVLCVLLAHFSWAIWPLPSSHDSGNTTLWMPEDVIFKYNGLNNTAGYTDLNSTSAIIVNNAYQRAMYYILKKSFIPWKFHPRASNFEPAIQNKTFIATISLEQMRTDPLDVASYLAGGSNEAYNLTLLEDGTITITADYSVGLVRGLSTLSQLFYLHSEGGSYTNLAPIYISDMPQFPHRGLNLDTSRHFIPMNDLLRTIDALALNKFNRLHVHATDSQSWPLEIDSMPDLAAKGAYRPELTYNASEIRRLQQYGYLQGVQVYVEVGVPGHSASIWYSRPDLIAAYDVQPDWNSYAAQPPSGTLKLNSSDVYEFMEELFDDLLPRLNPYSSYFHTGGDEVNSNAYNLDETVQTNDTEVLQPLLQRFVSRNHDQIREFGMTPMVWEEMLLEWELELGEDVVIQTWQSSEALVETVKLGHKALAGNYNYWYLDCGHGQWIDFFPGQSSEAFWPYEDYCSPKKNWRLMYSYDPLDGVPENMTDLVLGGECHMWTEQTDAANLDAVVWPRAAAVGEVLWSGAKDSQGQNRSQVEASPRLAEMRERLISIGIGSSPVHMPYCTMNGTRCAL